MNPQLRSVILKALDAMYKRVFRWLIFRIPAQQGHDWARRLLLNAFDRIPGLDRLCAALHQALFTREAIEVGGARLSQSLILAAGALKGWGFPDEAAALAAAKRDSRNVIAGWRIVPALLGPVEFGSFTRHPRLGNAGTVVWRQPATRSTQNRIGLRNPGARAAARFLGARRQQLPAEFGINIAATPELHDSERQQRDILESLDFFLEAGVYPSWFTLNISCPNTEDDPQALQLESETRQLCSAFVGRLRERGFDIPLWVKISPGLAAEQYGVLMRVFHEVGVRAVVATNTIARQSPEDRKQLAGVGGGDLFPAALETARLLLEEKRRGNYAVDVIACGGILDGASFRAYRDLGVKAGQYWSALVYRGPLAAAIIANEMAEREHGYEAVHRQSLA